MNADEHQSRLEQMSQDLQDLTWDLSSNDRAAIYWALDEITALRKVRDAARLYFDEHGHGRESYEYTRALGEALAAAEKGAG